MKVKLALHLQLTLVTALLLFAENWPVIRDLGLGSVAALRQLTLGCGGFRVYDRVFSSLYPPDSSSILSCDDQKSL